MTLLEETQWRPLADALREEVKEYGWLLSLLDQQQKGILARDYEHFLEMTHSIDEQIRVAARQRHLREERWMDFKETSGMDPEVRLRDFVRHLPSGVKDLFDELLRELERTAERLQQRSRQNKLLLARAHELACEVVSLLRPQEVSRTYSARGGVHLKTTSRPRALSLRA